jgi:hypothetical protein
MSVNVEISKEPGIRTGGFSLLLLAMLAAALVLCLQIAFGITSGDGLKWDFANFYDAGHKALAGETAGLYDPTVLIEGNSPQGSLAFYGTPLSAYLYAPLALFSPVVALVLFKVLSTIANLAGLFILYTQYRKFAKPAFSNNTVFLSLFVIAVALYQPFWEIYQVGGQTTPLVFLALVLALRWHTEGRDNLAALCLVLAVAIKPAFLLALVVLACLSGLSGRKFIAYATGMGLSLAAISIVLMGWPIHAAFLQHIRTHIPKPWLYNSSLTVTFDNFQRLLDPQPDPFAFNVMSTIVRVAVTGLFIWVFARNRSRIVAGAPRRHLDFLVAVTSCLLLMPVVWEHYLALLFIPLSYCLAVQQLLPRYSVFLLGLIFLVSITQNIAIIEWLGDLITFNTRLELIAAGLFKSMPLALTALFFIFYHKAIVATHCSPEWKPAS